VGSPRASLTISTLCGGRLARHTRATQRQRVGNRRKRTPAPPAPHRANVDRMVGSSGIEVMAGGKTALGQLLGSADVFMRRLAHGHEHDPLAGRRRPRRALNGLDDIGHGVKAGDGDAASRLETLAVRMRMCVEEPRQHRTAREIDEAGRRSGLFAECRIIADRCDVTRPHRDGLGYSGATIERDDLPAVQDQIGRQHESAV
jgi:hypothetical protein